MHTRVFEIFEVSFKRKVFVPLKVSSQTPRFSGVGPFPKFVFARIFPYRVPEIRGKEILG